MCILRILPCTRLNRSFRSLQMEDIWHIALDLNPLKSALPHRARRRMSLATVAKFSWRQCLRWHGNDRELPVTSSVRLGNNVCLVYTDDNWDEVCPRKDNVTSYKILHTWPCSSCFLDSLNTIPFCIDMANMLLCRCMYSAVMRARQCVYGSECSTTPVGGATSCTEWNAINGNIRVKKPHGCTE